MQNNITVTYLHCGLVSQVEHYISNPQQVLKDFYEKTSESFYGRIYPTYDNNGLLSEVIKLCYKDIISIEVINE